MSRAMVTVVVMVDREDADKAGQLDQAARFLAQFKAQGEDWQREVAADPILSDFLFVVVREHKFP